MSFYDEENGAQYQQHLALGGGVLLKGYFLLLCHPPLTRECMPYFFHPLKLYSPCSVNNDSLLTSTVSCLAFNTDSLVLSSSLGAISCTWGGSGCQGILDLPCMTLQTQWIV